MKTNDKLTKCNTQFCTQDVAFVEEQNKVFGIAIQGLLNDFTANKITYKQFDIKYDKIKNAFIKSKVSRELMACSKQMCDSKVRAVFEALGKSVEYDCKKGNTSDCKDLISIQKILKKTNITVDDYLDLLQSKGGRYK
jgi:hypothetical protein